jgi:helicase
MMHISAMKDALHPELYAILSRDISDLRPAQEKAVHAGLLEGRSLLVCTPTASGKTLIAEIAGMNSILSGKGKALYIAPLKALAAEKHKEFTRKYPMAKIVLSIGDYDTKEERLAEAGFIITTSEKLDSLIRHHVPWIRDLSVVVIDEIHLLNDPGRGPTLEILITILKKMLKGVQLIGLSATIGNPQELADWLGASLVLDSWRPVELHQGVYLEGEIEFKKK